MKSRPIVITAAAIALLGLLWAGVAYAQESKTKERVVVSKATAHAMMPPGGEGMMPELPADIQKKLLDQEMKLLKDNAPIRSEIELKRLEMRQLWLDPEPNADKLIAKLREINKLEMQLRENELSNRLAIYRLLPEEHRKHFLKGQLEGPGGPVRRMMRRDFRTGPMGMRGCCPKGCMCPCGMAMEREVETRIQEPEQD
ncbi:MAG: periplasmic heavy metal sensor [candidate division WOR-3 bacterium]